MKYICKTCNYESNDKSNYNKHINSSSHINKSNQSAKMHVIASHINSLGNLKSEFECQYCGQKFTRNSTLTKHKQICMDAKVLEKQKELEQKLCDKDKEIEIKLLQQKLAQYEKDNNKLDREIKELKSFIKSGKFGQTYNISIKKYIQQNYSDAPSLDKLEYTQYAKLTYEPDDKKSNNNKDNDSIDSDKETDQEKNEKLIYTLIHHYNNDTLYKFLGDFIIKNYKKEDPSTQAIWNSDVSRLTYIIKELMANNIESQWNADYKGVKTKGLIITPLLKFIKKSIDDYWMENIDNIKILDTKELESLQRNLIILQKIKKEIRTNVLADNIVKFIAPDFYMNKGDEKLIEHFIDEDINFDE